MDYKDNDLYKAFRLKLSQLERELSGRGHDHTLSKLGMFAEDAFSEQQATLDRLEQEKEELVGLIMTSNARVHYMALQVAKGVAKDRR